MSVCLVFSLLRVEFGEAQQSVGKAIYDVLEKGLHSGPFDVIVA